MKRGLFVAALAAVVLVVPAAAAAHVPRVRLAVVSLPKAALGTVGRSLALSRDSGVVDNGDAANNSVAAKPTTFDRLGRITGYALTYGDRYSGGSGVTEISTGVDEYKTSADARRGLAFWRNDDPKITVLEPYGLAVTAKALKAASVGKRRFAEGVTFTVPNAAPLAHVDEQFTDGRYVLHVDVAAGSLSAAAGVAAKLARALEHRLRLAETGHLRGKPVKLVPALKAGPPVGGPDLATLALTRPDFGGQATILDQGYGTPSRLSLSEYVRDMQPAGNFAVLSQIIDWFPQANNATVLSRLEGTAMAYVFTAGFLTGTRGQFTPVDLSAVGDNAYGGIVSVAHTGLPTVYLVVFTLASGQAMDVVLASSNSQIQAADVVNLAQAVANRLNAGLAG